MNEELRDKKRFEGFRNLTPEERNSLRDWKPAITKEEREQLRVLESNSTPVVGWYAHNTEVRGPFCRWFTCSDVSPEYQKHVAYTWDDCKFAAGAMNNLLPLLDALDAAEAENAKLREALEFYASNKNIYQDGGALRERPNCAIGGERARKALENI